MLFIVTLGLFIPVKNSSKENSSNSSKNNKLTGSIKCNRVCCNGVVLKRRTTYKHRIYVLNKNDNLTFWFLNYWNLIFSNKLKMKSTIILIPYISFGFLFICNLYISTIFASPVPQFFFPTNDVDFPNDELQDVRRCLDEDYSMPAFNRRTGKVTINVL